MILPGYISEHLLTYYNLAKDDRHALMRHDLFTDDPAQCPYEYLSFFSAEEGVEWSDELMEPERRNIILSSRDRHMHAGTVFSIKEMLRAISLSFDGHEAEIVEYNNRDKYKYDIRRNGVSAYNGSAKHNSGQYFYDFIFTGWADFYVVIKTDISKKQESLLRKLIWSYQAKRSVLMGIVANIKQRDASIHYDGAMTHGLI